MAAIGEEFRVDGEVANQQLLLSFLQLNQLCVNLGLVGGLLALLLTLLHGEYFADELVFGDRGLFALGFEVI